MNEREYDRIWSYVVEHKTDASDAVSMFNEIKQSKLIPSDFEVLFMRDVFECIESALAYGEEII